MSTAITTKERNYFLDQFAQFEKEHDAGARPALRRLRNAAIARFAELGFPTDRDEDWKFTSLSPLKRTQYLPPASAAQPMLPTTGGKLPNGVLVCTLAAALREHPQLVEPHLGAHADYKKHPFVALNTAFLQDGAFIYVPRDVVATEPIVLTIDDAGQPGRPVVWHRRVLIILEANSQATVVERYAGADTQYFTNAVTEISVGENAHLDHYKIQQESATAIHFAASQIRQSRSSRFSTHYVSLGGSLVRNEVSVYLDGEGCESVVNGLYMADGTQHVDNRTTIDHAKPNCASHELYKGILNGKAHGVFNGKIYVHQDAQKTDAKQTNQTLLLSDDAVINTKPQLEIFADDVKCTHGATVGQLDDTAIFYLRSRGIGEEAARSLLTFAFANDIVSRIKVESIRADLEKHLLAAQGLPGQSQLEEAL